MSESESDNAEDLPPDIAIVGLAGRFPQADDVAQLWANLVAGRDCISRFDDEELAASGIPEQLYKHPAYVPARGVMRDPALFDAPLFGFSALEAKITDPQHRVFLECAWEALEDAGHDPARYGGAIGVFAGCDVNSYALGHLLTWTHDLQSLLGNDKDHLATRVAFRLNLRGPALTVQTACSTSLVAVSLACQSLLSYACDMALAGGVGIAFPQRAGYLYQEGGILSPDGHCRAFDSSSRGTVNGDGCGVVVLKRLEDALADGDSIYALIKGAALNNDGSDKIGYTAPSVSGQAEAIAIAQAMADVAPETIGYVEAHGTGTQLGDPIEITALDDVFKRGTELRGFCALGSLKSNVGHMNSAAGVGGLIKATLSLAHRQIPPSLHYHKGNTEIGWADSCFVVNTQLRPFPPGPQGDPRRAAVSSFGVGGTNAHAVLEEAPAPAPVDASRGQQLIQISAQTEAALETLGERLADHLEATPELELEDVAYTLALGRAQLPYRRHVVVHEAKRLREALGVAPVVRADADPRVVFMFPGQGSQHLGMGAGLYGCEEPFTSLIDQAAELLRPELDFDLRDLIRVPAGREAELEALLARTRATQPALYALEYALAQQWRAWGVEPHALLGHSVGELVAATVADTLSFADGLRVVAERARLADALPEGAMLAVFLGEGRLREWLAQVQCEGHDALALAAFNSPELSVLSGPSAAIDAARSALAAKGVTTNALRTSHAFHSAMLEPMLAPYRESLGGIELRAPELPWVSNLSGTWIRADEANSPDYWAMQLRRPVRFVDCVRTVLEEDERPLLFLEVGPGRTLGAQLRRFEGVDRTRVIRSMRHPNDQRPDRWMLLDALGALVDRGVPAKLDVLYAERSRRRVRLPAYPFERQRYWYTFDPLEKLRASGALGEELGGALEAQLGQRRPVEEWLYTASWRRGERPARPAFAGLWLLTGVGSPEAERLAQALEQAGATILRPAREALDWGELGSSLGAELGGGERLQLRALELAGLGSPESNHEAERARLGALLERNLGLLRAASEQGWSVDLTLVTQGSLEILARDRSCPERACLQGFARVAKQELEGIELRLVDVDADELREPSGALLAELGGGEAVVGIRGGSRFVPNYARFDARAPRRELPLREGGVYLIAGGLGGIGMRLADHLARSYRARLILTSRAGLVAREEWDAWLTNHRAEDPVSRRITQIRALEAGGAEIMVASADVAELERMREVVARAHARFGAIEGMIHAAGMSGASVFRAAARTELEHVEAQLRAKLDGARVLAQLLPEQARFCVLISSLSTALGGVGLLAYALASHSLDAFALAKARAGDPRFLSIAWDAWEGEGGLDALSVAGPISAKEGARCLEDALRLDEGVAVAIASTKDVDARMREWRALQAAREATRGERERGTIHPRPELDVPYEAPRTELEAEVAQLWAELFSLERVGVNDNFFALGGDSLTAIQLASRLREAHGVELSVNELFEQATVASVSQQIERARAREGERAAELDATLSLVENMSDEEVLRMLAELEQKPGGTA